MKSRRTILKQFAAAIAAAVVVPKIADASPKALAYTDVRYHVDWVRIHGDFSESDKTVMVKYRFSYKVIEEQP